MLKKWLSPEVASPESLEEIQHKAGQILANVTLPALKHSQRAPNKSKQKRKSSSDIDRRFTERVQALEVMFQSA